MKTVSITAIGKHLEARTVAKPVLRVGEVLVQITAAGICHSDVHYRDGVATVAPLPHTPGHEIAGVVVELGPSSGPTDSRTAVPGPRVGDRVCIHYLVTCRRCQLCTTGREQWCSSAKMIGKDRDGGYAEYIAVPIENAIRIPESVTDEHAAVMMCSSATSLHAIRKARLKHGETVAVFGCGGLGLSAIQAANILGASVVFGVDVNQEKLELAQKFGAISVDAANSDPSAVIQEITGGVGVDVALELVGRGEAVQQAIASVGIGGRVAVVGVTNQPVGVNPYQDLIGKEAELIGVSDHHADEIRQLLGWAENGKFDLTDVVVNRVELDADQINPVLDALASGIAAARTVILPDVSR